MIRRVNPEGWRGKVLTLVIARRVKIALGGTRMRVLRVLGGYLACACIFLSTSGGAGSTEEAEIVRSSLGSDGTETTELRVVPRFSLESLPERVGFKYLHKCDELADLDISAEYFTGQKRTIEHGDIVVYIPHDIEYLKRLRDDNTLSNSVASLISSGTFGKGIFGQNSQLKIKVDAGCGILINVNGTGPKYYTSSYSVEAPLIRELVGPLCGGRKEGIAVNELLDDAIKQMSEKGQGAPGDLSVDRPEMDPHSENDVLMDFVYSYELEKSGKEIPENAGVVLPIRIDHGAGWISRDCFRTLELYMKYISRGVSLTSAAFYVPHVDGKDHGESIDSFFAVVELLRNHDIFSNLPSEGLAPSGASILDARRQEHGFVIKTDIDVYINDDNPFRILYKAIWEHNLGPGSSLIAPSRNVPYKVGEGFGGFVLLVPFSNRYYT